MIRPVQVLVIRSALVMSLVIVVVCLALAGQVTTAADEVMAAAAQTEAAQPLSKNQFSEPATQSAAQPENLPPSEQPVPASSEECQVSDSFPEEVRQWCELITRYADEHNVAPDLVAAVIWLESGGKAAAYSRSGAVGLMQVMPRDGIAEKFQCINGPCFASRPTIEELEDPAYNIEYGTRMLAGLFERKNSWRDALRSYGPMDVGYSYADKVLAIYERYGSN
jgi:soluble lytic murein transglycosylase-like protein